jgi:type I restriction enzyme M protein
VIDGWVDAIGDAVEEDDATGPAFDPFGHRLVRRTMADYLERIAEARADIARLKGEKEAFESSNATDDADEEELASWNYAKDLDRQARELKAEHKDTLKNLKKLETAAAKAQATDADRHAATQAKTDLKLVLDQLAQIETALAPYDQIKTNLAAARARCRELTNAFVDELKDRCGVMTDDNKRALVLELFAEDVQIGLDAAVSEKRQELVRFVEGLWNKYRESLHTLKENRSNVEDQIAKALEGLGYGHA